MSLLQKVLIILVGACLAASFYLYIAASMSHGVVSYHAAIYVLAFGWLAFPAIAIALNITKRSKLTIILGCLSGPPIVLYFLVAVLRLPGAEWMYSGLFGQIMLLQGLAALILVLRLPQAIPILLTSFVCCLVAGVFAVHFMTKWALQNQIERTLADGGCAISGMVKQRYVTAADDVDIGWIVGPRSEPVYLVYDLYYLRWSYSRFGLDVRAGIPKKYEPTDIALTQRYAQTDKLGCD